MRSLICSAVPAPALSLARLAVGAGHDVVLSNRRGPETLAVLGAEVGPHARAATPAEAAPLRGQPSPPRRPPKPTRAAAAATRKPGNHLAFLGLAAAIWCYKRLLELTMEDAVSGLRLGLHPCQGRLEAGAQLCQAAADDPLLPLGSARDELL